jgi:hypothetical protein
LGAWLVAVLIARIAHLGQHEFLGQPYLLVPVNLPSFYFLPLFAAGVYWLAKRQNRVSSSVQLALLLSLAFTGGRFLYWWSVARDWQRIRTQAVWKPRRSASPSVAYS